MKQYWGLSWYEFIVLLVWKVLVFRLDDLTTVLSFWLKITIHAETGFILRRGTGDYAYIGQINPLAIHDIKQQNRAKHSRVHMTYDIL